ncbi:hypothetical protein DDE05_23090, partial [Streptomyces cavourensis]
MARPAAEARPTSPNSSVLVSGSDRVRRVQVQDAAGDGVHVERPGPERAVTAAQGVELLHRHRVRLLVEGDDR